MSFNKSVFTKNDFNKALKLNRVSKYYHLVIITSVLFLSITFSTHAQTESFPSRIDLPINKFMPNPFVKLDGTGPKSLEEWPAHRKYLLNLIQHYLYGRVPPRPTWKELSFEQISDVSYTPPDSKIVGRKQVYKLTINRNSLSHSFNITLYRPGEKKTYPVLIANYADNSYGPEEGVRRGYVFVIFDRREVASDEKVAFDRTKGLFGLYPEPEYDWRTIAAWGWAYQLVIDVVDSLGLLDTNKIMVTGHSRGGQGAMAGAILDERIDMVAPSTGGPWSLGSHRQRDTAGFRGDWDMSYFARTSQPHWYHPRYWDFGYDKKYMTSSYRQNKLPWDVSTLVALVAPRAICHVSSVDDKINNWLAHEVGVRTGQLVHSWWGEDRSKWVRLHWRGVTNEFGQKGHDMGIEEYNAIYDFSDEYFYDSTPGPTSWNVSPGKDTWEYEPAKYPLLIDWQLPPKQVPIYKEGREVEQSTERLLPELKRIINRLTSGNTVRTSGLNSSNNQIKQIKIYNLTGTQIAEINSESSIIGWENSAIQPGIHIAHVVVVTAKIQSIHQFKILVAGH